MNRTTITFTDGTELRGCAGNPPRGRDTKTDRTCIWRADLSGLYDGEELVRRVEARPAGAGAATTSTSRSRSRARSSGSSRTKGGGDSTRWATLNAFVDVVLRHLSPTEGRVWLILFRDARGDLVDASQRDLGRRAACGQKAAWRAMTYLRRVGLVEPVTLSRARNTASRYRLNPHPERCLDAITKSRGTDVTMTSVHDEEPMPAHPEPVSP